MDDRSNNVVLTVRLSPALSGRLIALADTQKTTRSALVRHLIERALSGDPVTVQNLEKSLRFIHIAIDALLRHHPQVGIRDEVLRIQKAVATHIESTPILEGRP
ncbi:CopG family transcriptional regulator [Sphingomonas sp. BIUV-7]|uniref:CopG family transcriptional regulator n=1 Tax=Sphingomonas natans TaxID=3063330 RepID=A0ABT8Y938_9SPHN|nr:CopG family transcriptional regulator [Sphingomonas sp. BIUV-7]MDO6414358.1 CopG family transcriptional regulator [Sphingomonas sp. BIUV-7]